MKKIFWLNQLDEAKQNFWSYNYFLIIITSATPFFWLDLFDSLTRTFFSINNSREIYGLLKVLFDNVFYLWKKSIYLWTEILNKDLSAVNYVQLSRRTIYSLFKCKCMLQVGDCHSIFLCKKLIVRKNSGVFDNMYKTF